MAGILYVVATPIGNLEDVTLRALRVLREVAVIAAEDTRRTAHLLQHYSISTRTTSLNEHNEHRRVPGLLSRLQAGESIALVSDAGTPLVSDPGRLLVTAAHAAGIRVEPIPGPNAAIAAASASGLVEDGFVFVQFPPPKAAARARWLADLSAERRAIIFYEAPHRIRATIEEAMRHFGERTIFVARELTKAFESYVIRPINQMSPDELPELGEYVVVIGPGTERSKPLGGNVSETEALRVFGELTNNEGFGGRQAARMVGERFGVSANWVYRLAARRDK